MLDKAEDYLIRSAECVVLGNFTDEVTVLGVGVQIVLGIFDLDLPCDIRDIIADIKNLAETDRVRWDLIGMLALDLIGLIPVIGALKYSDEIGTLFKNADKVSVVARSTDGAGVLAKHADEAGAWLHGGKVFRYSDETAEAVASGEKLLKESQTVYESFADMMSPDDAAKYLDFLENGSKEGLTSAELAGVEKADALLVSQKVGYEDVWDLRNVGDALETSYGKSREIIQCNTKDAAADELAKRIGGQSRSAFADDPIQREFDVISDQYIAQAKPPLKCVNKTVRTQMKATFEATKKYERKVYYQFEGIPSQEVLDKLYEYSERYGVEVIIDTEPLGILN
ncbi:MAG: restriction endonuclease fold toxin [Roseburia inulinivorans]